MNFIAALFLTKLWVERFQFELVWNVLFSLLVWRVLKALKKPYQKVLLFIVLLFVIPYYPNTPASANFVPNKTYVILSEGQESKSVGFHNVDEAHLDIVKEAFSESSNFIEYKNETDALSALRSNDVSRLVIENGDQIDQDKIVGRIKAVTQPQTVKNMTTDSFLIYVSGLDALGDTPTRSRSDMNLLLAFNPQTNKASMVSLARDTFVPLSCKDGAMDKLTHAGLYGVDCQIQTLESLFDIEIDFYVQVQFNGFVDFIDTLGGVHVDNTQAFADFEVGELHLDGTSALRFVRARDDVIEGDVGRGLNGQKVVKGIFEAVNESSSKAQLLKELYPYIDTNIDVSNAVSFTKTMRNYDIVSDYLKGEGDMQMTYSQPDGFKYYVSWPDKQSILDISNLLNNTLKGD